MGAPESIMGPRHSSCCAQWRSQSCTEFDGGSHWSQWLCSLAWGPEGSHSLHDGTNWVWKVFYFSFSLLPAHKSELSQDERLCLVYLCITLSFPPSLDVQQHVVELNWCSKVTFHSEDEEGGLSSQSVDDTDQRPHPHCALRYPTKHRLTLVPRSCPQQNSGDTWVTTLSPGQAMWHPG